jgi:hypothetical protein
MPVCANHHFHPAWKAVILWKFHGAQAEAMPSKMCLDPVGQCVTAFLRKGVRQELHDTGIAVQPSEWFPIGLTPVAQDQALSNQNWAALS